MLIYTGGGFGGSLPNIPARDLSDEEVMALGGEARLIATGLYAKDAPTPTLPRSQSLDHRAGRRTGEGTSRATDWRAAQEQDKEKQP